MSKLYLLPSEPVDEAITITWNTDSEDCFATCDRCAESAQGGDSWAWNWAESHVCDPERVALLSALDQRAA